ncbi:recombinase family protein, partial [Roseomonas sp. HJA6]|nr:recombinase family protein [Neoroseomonas alba]
MKGPDTGRRVARPNPREERAVQDLPELRVVDQELRDAVKARQRAISAEATNDGENHFRDRRRPRYLLSGLTRYGWWGGTYALISSKMLGCSTAGSKGTSGHHLNIRRDRLEERILDTLQTKLMNPMLFAAFCDEFTPEMNRLRMEGRASIAAAWAEVKRIERDFKKILDLYLKDTMPIETAKERSGKLEARKIELTRFLEGAEEPLPVLHPSMALIYRERVAALHRALLCGVERALVEDGELAIGLLGDLAGVLRGDLAGIVSLASNAK